MTPWSNFLCESFFVSRLLSSPLTRSMGVGKDTNEGRSSREQMRGTLRKGRRGEGESDLDLEGNRGGD